MRATFAKKLDKYLSSYKLPLQFLSILVLGSVDPDVDQQKTVR